MKMDNIRIKEKKNKLIIKKGWIAKKFIILYFVIIAIALLIYAHSSLSNNEFERKYPSLWDRFIGRSFTGYSSYPSATT